MTEEEEKIAFDAEPLVAMGKAEERREIVASLLSGCQRRALKQAFHALQEAEQFDASSLLMANFREAILGDMQ